MLPRFVIAVSGTSGAGKSTIVEGLAAAAVLRGRRVVTLQFDDYVGASMLPDDLQDWLERGANPDDWRTDQLIADLMTSIAAGSEPETLIIVEEPFGRARPPMRTLVDLGIHIDLPLGVALARRLLRDFVPGLADPTGQGAQRLRDYLTQYVRVGGAAYQAIDEMVRQTSDVVRDGLSDPSELLEQAERTVEQQLLISRNRQSTA